MCFYGSCFSNKVLGDADFKKESSWTVALADPNHAIATDREGNKHKGTWTTVYDEGFEVDVGGKKFFAFSKFDHGKSLCKGTWPGWHRDATNPDGKSWGCYQGSKEKETVSSEDLALLSESERELASQENLALIDIESGPEEQPKKGFSSEAGESPMYQPEHDLVSRINARAAGWKAKVYPQWEKLTQSDFNRMAGFRAAGSPRRRLPSMALIEEDVAHLPPSFDWRNKDGQNYLDKVLSQGCGSCYAVSTTSMINSRIRIATKNRVQPQIPYNQVLACDKRYGQGCAGGYPFLVEKYAQEFGLTKTGTCAKSSKQLKDLGEAAAGHEAYIRVTDFGYVGGYYGGTTTAEMMQELHDNGPIVVGLNGGFELMHYDSGIFIETGEGSGEGKIRNDFERVEHAVLAVGWGQEGNNKYWILKNSFGAGWGEHGYFRVPRGGDADGVTSLVTAATPVLGDSSYFSEIPAQQSKQGSDSAVENDHQNNNKGAASTLKALEIP
jgi:cathepsin C